MPPNNLKVIRLSSARFDYEVDAEARATRSTQLVEVYLNKRGSQNERYVSQKVIWGDIFQGVKKAPLAVESQL